jgi:hypothetical protein
VSTADLFYALAFPPAFAFVLGAVTRALRIESSWAVAIARSWVSGGVGVVFALAQAGHWPGTVIGVAQVGVGVWLWRRGRRGRRRAPRAYGAKSRALVAVLVATLRDAARPRPVLRPVPGAA